MSSASRGLVPREGLGCFADEDGPYRPANLATAWAAGRQVWGPSFPECRQQPLGPRCARAWLLGEAKGQVRSIAGPNSLQPWSTRGG